MSRCTWNELRRPSLIRIAASAALVLGLAGPASSEPLEPPSGPVEAPSLPDAALAAEREISSFAYAIHHAARPGPSLVSLSGRGRRDPAYPMLLIDWQMTDRLTLTAGRELCTSAGPGAHAIYELADDLDLTFGFRFERTRFRLAPRPGLDLGGIGVEQSTPAFATLRFGQPDAFVALVAGAELRGRLWIEDERGGSMDERLTRPSPFVGLAGRVSF